MLFQKKFKLSEKVGNNLRINQSIIFFFVPNLSNYTSFFKNVTRGFFTVKI